MSLAVLARKTRTMQRSRSNKRGHVLNMTGRGNVRGECCSANGVDSAGRINRPAPQVSYRTYINRKTSGAFRPSGHNCCDTAISSGKNLRTWKQHPNIAASEITEHRKHDAIRCDRGMEVRNRVTVGDNVYSNKLTAKAPCSVSSGQHPLKSYGNKGRLAYTRINNVSCNVTKRVEQGRSASDHIGKVRQRAFLCDCTGDCVNNPKSAQCFNYCYQRPMNRPSC